jgi:uncharacterized delta-60 repeat protein
MSRTLTLTGCSFVLALLLPYHGLAQAGALDLSFYPADGPDAVFPYVETIAIQSDGRSVIGGQFSSFGGTPRNNIARLNLDGSLDVTFDPGAGASDDVQSIAIQSDGRIVIGGDFTSYNGTSRNKIARLNSDGSLDLTFDPGTGAGDIVPDIRSTAIQSDGKIVIGGNFTSYNGTSRNNIARLNPDGSLDTTFEPGEGTDGIVLSVAIQSDGKIIIGGGFNSSNGMTRNSTARLNADGSLDTTFDPGVGPDSGIWTTSIQNDGKIVIGGGFVTYNGMPMNRITRLNADGSQDVTFNPGTGAIGSVWSSAIQSDGRIVIGGYFNSYDGTSRNHIARLNADGSLDTTFDPGTGATGGINGNSPYVQSVAIQSDGRILIGGQFTQYNGTSIHHIARLYGALSTGISSVAGSGFSMFPNPASTSVTIVLPAPYGRTAAVVRNALGQVVLRSTVAADRNDIALNGLAPGLYTVQVVGTAAQRLVVE